jgi:hypothetical protein
MAYNNDNTSVNWEDDLEDDSIKNDVLETVKELIRKEDEEELKTDESK